MYYTGVILNKIRNEICGYIFAKKNTRECGLLFYYFSKTALKVMLNYMRGYLSCNWESVSSRSGC